jgi:hypothetical protein
VQVDRHRELGTLLGIAIESAREQIIGERVVAARHRSFDRRGAQRVTTRFERELGARPTHNNVAKM